MRLFSSHRALHAIANLGGLVLPLSATMMRDADAFLQRRRRGKPAHQLFTTMGFLEKKGGSTRRTRARCRSPGASRRRSAPPLLRAAGGREAARVVRARAYHAGEMEAGSFELAAGARFFLKEVGGRLGSTASRSRRRTGASSSCGAARRTSTRSGRSAARALPDADAEAAEARLASRSAKFRADVGEMKKVPPGAAEGDDRGVPREEARRQEGRGRGRRLRVGRAAPR